MYIIVHLICNCISPLPQNASQSTMISDPFIVYKILKINRGMCITLKKYHHEAELRGLCGERGGGGGGGGQSTGRKIGKPGSQFNRWRLYQFGYVFAMM